MKPFDLRVLCRRCVSLCSGLLFVLTGAFAGYAAPYTFLNIADTSGIFSDLGTPSINASGTVAFLGLLDAGGSGIYTGNSNGVTPVALSSEPKFSGFGTSGTPINAAGRVAFLGDLEVGGGGIFTSDGVTLTEIATNGSFFAAFPLQIPLAINETGTVAFEATFVGGKTGIFTGHGGPTTMLYSSDEPMFSSFAVPIGINKSGTAAFEGFLDAGGSGVFSGDGGPPASIALSSGPFTGFTGNQLSINNSGTVAFIGGLDSGSGGVFVGNGSGLAIAYATNRPPFANLNYPSINNSGTVAFFASLQTGAAGIYTGQDAVTNKVVRNGDSLFGSTVNNVRFSTSGLNDAGQIAFFYSLTDGRRGIAVATPPLLRILSIRPLVNGTMHLEVSGVSNLTHIIQATTNLNQTFGNIGTRTAAADGTFPFDDTNAPTFSQRFYRIALP